MGRGGLTAAGRRLCVGLALAGLLALLAGCGSRTPTPALLRPAGPGGFQVMSYPRVGVRLVLPRAWTTVPAHLPQVAFLTSDRAVISLWRYWLHTPPPRSPARLLRAKQRLIATARTRDHGLRVIVAHTASVGGYPAVELQTVQRIGSQVRRVSSTHLFGRGEEIVLEEYAPVRAFPGLDRSVFSAVRRSLTALSH